MASMDNIARFSNRVENYIKYRPDYPREIINYLTENAGLTTTSVVADVGCGPGISSKMFLENGNRVIGVEPNDAMRAAAIEYLGEFPDFTVVDGRSDATTLNDDSIDMVVVGQAFHWFEPEGARVEFARILKPDGAVVLMWNERQLDSTTFLQEYEAFIDQFALDYSRVRHENVKTDDLAAFFKNGYQKAVFPNVQIFNYDGLKGRLLSSSYIPAEGHPSHEPMLKELETLFAKHNENGKIEVFYDTTVYVSRPFLWQ
jgi:SAM-dependent methyltransferase